MTQRLDLSQYTAVANRFHPFEISVHRPIFELAQQLNELHSLYEFVSKQTSGSLLRIIAQLNRTHSRLAIACFTRSGFDFRPLQHFASHYLANKLQYISNGTSPPSEDTFKIRFVNWLLLAEELVPYLTREDDALYQKFLTDEKTIQNIPPASLASIHMWGHQRGLGDQFYVEFLNRIKDPETLVQSKFLVVPRWISFERAFQMVFGTYLPLLCEQSEESHRVTWNEETTVAQIGTLACAWLGNVPPTTRYWFIYAIRFKEHPNIWFLESGPNSPLNEPDLFKGQLPTGWQAMPPLSKVNIVWESKRCK